MFKFDDLIKDKDYGFIFKEDKKFFDKYLKECQWNKETYPKSGSGDNNKCFQFGLRPQQIVGDINKAKIFLLNLNPSFHMKDEKNQQDDFKDEKKLKDILEEVLKSNGSPNIDYPFYCLDPELKDTGGYDWWNNGHHFKSYIDKGYDVKKLAKLFCCIELIPYHARKLPISVDKMLECHSVQTIKKHVKKLIQRAKKDIVIICLRSEKYWDIEKEINAKNDKNDKIYNIYLTPNRFRANFSINNEKSELVKKIIDIIERDK